MSSTLDNTLCHLSVRNILAYIVYPVGKTSQVSGEWSSGQKTTGPGGVHRERPWTTQSKGAHSAGKESDGGGWARVTAPVFCPELLCAGRNMMANPVCLLFPPRTKKWKENSKTTTFMSCVLSPPYRFWELVMSWSYNVFNSQRTLTFSKHSLYKDLSFPDWT